MVGGGRGRGVLGAIAHPPFIMHIRKHSTMRLIHFAIFHVLNLHLTFLLIANHYHPYNQFMLLLQPSVAKHEPESSELSSSDLSNIIDL